MTSKKPEGSSKRKSKSKPRIIEHPHSSEQFFTNRELGWLHFNRRVLFEAEDHRTPMLERLRFLSICNSNLDEFFMKRVGGLKRQLAYGITAKSSDGKTPIQQLKLVRAMVSEMVQAQALAFSKSLVPGLKEKKIFLLKWSELTKEEIARLHQYYMKNVFPVLTPLSVDPGHPFPFISNLSTSLGVTLKHPERGNDPLFARVKIPQVLPQWIRIEASRAGVSSHADYRYVSLIDLIRENLADLFPSMQVLKVMAFRLTRNADISRDDEDAEDLLAHIEEELRMRRFAEVVRLEHGPSPDPWMLQFLIKELEIADDDVFELPELLDYRGLGAIADLKIPELRYETWPSAVPLVFQDDNPVSYFNLIREQDQLLHHPYENFEKTVEKFIRISCEDPQVVAIKMSLYRTGDNSPFIKSLIRAAEMDKQVVCLVELKARFDEERNIYWAQELENAGVHVVYGIVGLKTHAKTALVVRQEGDVMRTYAHIGTGNYNVTTSRFYTDLGLLTCREEITSELVEFFHYLTGRSLKSNYEKLLVAPVNMFQRFKFMIEREGENAKAGKPAYIFAKMNNMEENDISLALYEASKKGVLVDMSVRGFCCLKPHLQGLSERIRVFSCIGRYLEHSRLFYFRIGQADPVDGDFYIGSADWMYRNLHARIECIVPILDRPLKEKLWEIIQLYVRDSRQTWDMNSNGEYTQRKNLEKGPDPGVQEQLQILTRQKNQATETKGQ